MNKSLESVFGYFGKSIVFLVLLLFLALSYSQRINLMTSDLGRHLKNGQIFFEEHHPIATNYYSYTEPNFPTVNHHWLTGVIFFLIVQWFGFVGVSVFYTILFLLTFYFFFMISRRLSNFHYAVFCTLLVVPLITSRLEIRPEGFSYLFLSIYFFLLYKFKLKEIPAWLLWIIPVLQILWVNIHIFFIFGLFILGVFWADAWWSGFAWARRNSIHENKGGEKFPDLDFLIGSSPEARQYFILLSISILVCFLNPFGFKGVLVPFLIFKEYGYMLAENQSVFFMQRRFPDHPMYAHFEAVFLLTAASFVPVFLRKEIKNNLLSLVLMGIFSLLAFKAIRMIPLFGLFAVPCIASNIQVGLTDCLLKNKEKLQKEKKIKKAVGRVFLSASVVLLFLGLQSTTFYYSPYVKLYYGQNIPEIRQSANWLMYIFQNPQKILGLIPGVNASAEFFQQNKIDGPIFNNYDIGGYLIYHLFPKEHVFVDNRPEAYSVSFFKDIYVPMQENEDTWKRMEEAYQFNAIYFFRRDITPWAQPFLFKRIQDPSWAPVFVDQFTIIFVKRNAKNATLIRRYELPKSMFQIEN